MMIRRSSNGRAVKVLLKCTYLRNLQRRCSISSSVEDFVRSQNEATVRWMKGVKTRYYDTLRKEMLLFHNREDKEEDGTEYLNGLEYYQRADEGDELYKYCRRDPRTNEEIVILNPNAMLEASKTSTSLAIGNLAVSTDHRYLAYCADFNGGVNWSLYVKGVEQDEIVRVIRDVESVEWCSSRKDNEYVMYYTKKQNRGDIAASKIYRRKFVANEGEENDEENLLLEMKTASSKQFFADLKSTKDGAYVLAYLNSKTRTVLYAFEKSNANAKPLRVWSSVDESNNSKKEIGQCFAEHNNNFWYLLTRSKESENLSLSRVSHQDISQGQIFREPQVLIPNREDVLIEDMDMFQDCCVLYERHIKESRARISLMDIMSSHVKILSSSTLPRDTYVIRPAPNADFLASKIRFTCSGPSLYPVMCTYSFDSNDVGLEEKLLHHVESEYVTYKEHVRSEDGTSVPVTITHHKDVKRDGMNPTLLLGYGAYGMPFEVDHCVGRSTLLSRGWVVAIAHVRGGGDLGTKWHEDGRTLRKRNSFEDFACCAKGLIDDFGLTSSNLLCASASSAGALLLGVCANEYPGLFRAMILNVPFLDVVSEMSDPSLPLTEHEYEEWGNFSTDARVREYIQGWCPVSNVRVQDYPAMLVTTSLDDEHVSWTHAAKWVDSVQRLNTSNNPILLRVDHDGTGHYGSGGRYQRYDAMAYSNSFLLGVLDEL